MAQKQYFGTDGIRGQVGVFPMSADFILKLGFAVGTVFKKADQNHVLIGKDTRISGYLFESALEAGFSSAGIDIHLLGPMPTPAVAYLTRTMKACVGIVISASHNPYQDNGIKFFTPSGLKLPDHLELEIESQLARPLDMVDSKNLGKAKRLDDAPGRYIEFCKSTFPRKLNLNNLKIVLDCANGATYQVAPSVFRELGAQVILLNDQPDGLNINTECGSTAPATLIEQVKVHQADLGIAFDGDGDRVLLVDERGHLVDGDEILYIIANAHQKASRLTGGVVGTIMSNLGLENALKHLGIAFMRTPVGDRHIIEALNKLNWNLGGEMSGHIVCFEHNTTGDGIISALQVLACMIQTGHSLSELTQGFNKYPQVLLNVPVQEKKKIMDSTVIKNEVVKIEAKLKTTGRVLLRPSGTEPLIRVMIEGEDQGMIEPMAQALADLVKKVAVVSDHSCKNH